MRCKIRIWIKTAAVAALAIACLYGCKTADGSNAVPVNVNTQEAGNRSEAMLNDGDDVAVELFSKTEALPHTMTIYDIEEGYLTVPYLPEMPHHNYEWGNIIKQGDYKYYAPDGQTYSRIGVDVSKYQGDIDWNQVKESGIQFAVMRLGYRGYSSGGLHLDEYYQSNMKGALNAGLDVGVYFFSQAVNTEEAVEEAEYVLDHIQDYPVSLPVVFDTEEIKNDESRTDGLTAEELTDITIGFCDTIESAGYRPMIYANAKWLTTRLDLLRLKQYPVWYADYQDQPLYPYAFEMWQYTEKGQVPGIQEPVDLNVWFN